MSVSTYRAEPRPTLEAMNSEALILAFGAALGILAGVIAGNFIAGFLALAAIAGGGWLVIGFFGPGKHL